MAVQDPREGVAGNSQHFGCFGHVQAERSQAVLPDAASGVRGIACGHRIFASVRSGESLGLRASMPHGGTHVNCHRRVLGADPGADSAAAVLKLRV